MKDLLLRALLFALTFYAIYKTLEKKEVVKKYNDLFVFFIVLSFLSFFKLELFLSLVMFFLPIFLFVRWRKHKWDKVYNEPIQYAELPQFAVNLSQGNNDWCKQNNYDPKKLIANRNKLIEFYRDNNFEKRLRDLFELKLHPAGITK